MTANITAFDRTRAFFAHQHHAQKSNRVVESFEPKHFEPVLRQGPAHDRAGSRLKSPPGLGQLKQAAIDKEGFVLTPDAAGLPELRIRRTAPLLSQRPIRRLLGGAACGLSPTSMSRTAPLRELQAEGQVSEHCRQRTRRYSNNRIESDHRYVKRRLRAMQAPRTRDRGWTVIQGIDAVQMIRKGQVLGTARWTELKRLLSTVFATACNLNRTTAGALESNPALWNHSTWSRLTVGSRSHSAQSKTCRTV